MNPKKELLWGLWVSRLKILLKRIKHNAEISKDKDPGSKPRTLQPLLGTAGDGNGGLVSRAIIKVTIEMSTYNLN